MTPEIPEISKWLVEALTLFGSKGMRPLVRPKFSKNSRPEFSFH